MRRELRRMVSTSRSLLGSLGIGSLLDSLTVVSLVDSELSQLLVDLSGLHLLGEWLDLASLDNLWEWENTVNSTLGDVLELLGGSVSNKTLLWLALNSWEQDQFSLVSS